MDKPNFSGDIFEAPNSWIKLLKGLNCGVLSQARYFFHPFPTSEKIVFQMIDATLLKTKGGLIMHLGRNPKPGPCQFIFVPNADGKSNINLQIPEVVVYAGEATIPIVRIIARAIEVTVIVSDNFRLWSAYQNDRKRIENKASEHNGPSEFATTASVIVGEWVVGIVAGKALSFVYGNFGSVIGTAWGPASSCALEFLGVWLGAYHGGNWGAKYGSKFGRALAQNLYDHISV